MRVGHFSNINVNMGANLMAHLVMSLCILGSEDIRFSGEETYVSFSICNMAEWNTWPAWLQMGRAGPTCARMGSGRAHEERKTILEILTFMESHPVSPIWFSLNSTILSSSVTYFFEG